MTGEPKPEWHGVQAIPRQTAAKTPGDFIGRFGERIQALAASQDLLVKNEWRGASPRRSR